MDVISNKGSLRRFCRVGMVAGVLEVNIEKRRETEEEMKVLRPHGRWSRPLSPSADLLPKIFGSESEMGGRLAGQKRVSG